MLRFWMVPPLHVVPGATACQTTEPPLQMPNCVLPLQTIAPSVLQVEEPAEPPVEPPVSLPLPALAGADAAGADAAGADATGTEVAMVASVDLAGAAEAAGADDTGADSAGELAAGAPDEGVEGAEPFAPQSPVGSSTSLVPPSSRFSPGLGNLTAWLRGLVHVVDAMLAMNMSGRASRPEASLAPPVTSIGAQFM